MRRRVLAVLLVGVFSFGVLDDFASARHRCHPSYKGRCLRKHGDYDCRGGGGNGPNFTGRVRVVGTDVFRLDADGDGIGCEAS